MLDISKEEAIAWRKEADRECLFNRTLSISLEAGTELPVSDANGKADPYCKIGLVSRGALRRNQKGKLEELVHKGSVVHISQVIPETLEPVWKESFEFEVRADELLLIEVWDSDKEPEKFMSITGIKGIKAKVKDHISPGQDDFMGRCVVDFATFDTSSPSSAWYELRSHSSKSYRGKINLTVQTHVCLVDSLLEAYKKSRQGSDLLEKFLLQAARHCTQMNIPFLKGRLPEPYLSASHAMQDLLIMSEFESNVVRLSLLAKYITKYTYVRDELCMIIIILTSLWEKQIEITPLKCVHNIIEHFYSIYQHELELLVRTSDVFEIAHLPAVLSSLTQVVKFLKFTNRLPEDLSLKDILKTRIIKDIDTWIQLKFAKAQPLSPNNPEFEQATALSEVCSSAAQYLANSWAGYQKPFKKIGISYFDIVYCRLEALLAEKIKEFFKTFDVKEHFLVLWKRGENHLENDILEKSKGALVIFRLYQGVRDVLQLSSHTENIPECGWCLQQLYVWFKPCIFTWIDINRSIAKICLNRVVLYDSGQVYDIQSNIKLTSSAVDSSLCFEQYYQFYEQLQWPVSEDTFRLATEHTVVGGDIAEHLAHLMLKKLDETIKEGIDLKKKFTIDENACLLLNNVYLIQDQLKEIPSRLKWASISKEINDPEWSPVDQLQEMLDYIIKSVKNIESKMIIMLGNYFEGQFRENYHDFLTQSYDIMFDTAIDPLMQWMVNNIQDSCDTLTQQHFIVLLNELWLKVTKVIIEYKDKKLRSDSQYKRLHLSLEVLYQFFYAKGDGLSEQQLQSFEFEIIQNYFKLYTIHTKCLIGMYYREQAKVNTTIQPSCGCLTFSVYYQTSRGTLNISILSGENFPRMGSFTGSCDPYITVNLLPDQNEMKTLKTKVHKKTLSALFNEEFSVEIPLKKLLENSKVVQLSLWNWDRLLQHEYAGSIYIDINDVAIIPTLFEDTEGKAKPITLNFMFPTDASILHVLGDRSVDKEATVFLKYVKGLMSAQSKIQATIASKLNKFSHFIIVPK